MRVLHVIPSLSMKHGGPSKALPVMAASLVREGVQVDVVTTDDDGPGERLNDLCGQGWIAKDGWCLRHFPKQTEFFKVSLPLFFWLLRSVRHYDVVHIHAVFSFATLAAGWSSMLAGVPFIVRPLGTLSTWSMANRRRWLKSASFCIVDRPVLNAASAIHCTSKQEAEEVVRLGLRSPAKVLPLGFDLGEFDSLPGRAEMESKWPATCGRQVLLFLSRLDPKKGVECLIDAFVKIHESMPQTLLVIAGSGVPEYVGYLKKYAAVREDFILWTGHVSGDDKRALLGGADLFVLPSRSENFGIALLEALASGLACVSTPGVALVHDENCQGAVILSPIDDVTGLAGSCLSLLRDSVQRQTLSSKARQAACAFSSELMATRLIEMYQRCTTVSSTLPTDP